MLLDVYGTLFRYEPMLRHPVFVEIIRAQGLAVAPDVLLERWRVHEAAFRAGRVYRQDGAWAASVPFVPYEEAWTGCFAAAFADLGLAGDPAAAVRTLLLDLQKREVYPEVMVALTALRARVPLALVTNADASFLFATLAHNHLAFDTIVYSEQEAVYKPHPRIFQAALERVGADPAEVLYAGDSPTEDILGAAGLGIPAVWINRRQEEWLLPEPRPAYEVPDLLGLVDVLASRSGIVY